MDQTEKTLLYEKHKKTIEKICRTISSKMNIDYDDIHSEANLVFVLCSDRYNQSKGPFEKFLSSAIYFRAFNLIKKRKFEQQKFVISTNFENFAMIVDDSLSALIDSTEKNCALSHDSEIIKNLLFDKLDHVTEECGSMEEWKKIHRKKQLITQRELRSEIRKNFQWPHDRINAAFQEISQSL